MLHAPSVSSVRRMPTSSPGRRCMSAAEPASDPFPFSLGETPAMDATVKRKARSPKGARGQALRPVEPAHDSDGAHLELRIWLRLLSCATRIEKTLNAKLRK